jgi:hypothetical protein
MSPGNGHAAAATAAAVASQREVSQ